MNKEFIPYKEALVLKELGFDEPCLGYYNTDPYLKKPPFNLNKPFKHEWCLAAPLYQQAFRWFREKYKMHCYILLRRSSDDKSYTFHICTLINHIVHEISEDVLNKSKVNQTHFEAELACLKKLIEITKEKSTT